MNEKYAVLRTHVQRYIYIYIFLIAWSRGKKGGTKYIARERAEGMKM